MPTISLQQLMTQNGSLPFTLPAWIALAPFEEYLGMEIRSAADGQALLAMPFRALHCQGAGLMHGGAITSLADTALAIAIKTLLPEATHFATIEMKLVFHAPVRWGTVEAHARVTERTDRDIRGEVDITTEDGVKAASFQAIFRVKRSGKPSS